MSGNPPSERFGPFVVDSLLGEGGMGTVWLVHDEITREPFAVKSIREELLLRTDLAARFRREVALLARIEHPSLVRIHEACLDATPPWYAMELLRGQSLRERVLAEGALDRDRALSMAGRIAAALGELHRAGVTHRDVKPENVMLVDDGKRFVLMDLGLAKAWDSTQLTRTGKTVGTPKYMSPEMLLGAPVGPASDVYQLALTLYYALAGKLPDEIEGGLETLLAHLRRRGSFSIRQDRPDLDVELETLLANGLHVDSGTRTPDVRHFLEDLADLRTGEGVRSRSFTDAVEGDTAVLSAAPVAKAETQPSSALEPVPGASSRGSGGLSRLSRFSSLALLLGFLLFGFARWMQHGEEVSVRAFTWQPGVNCVELRWESSVPVPTVVELALAEPKDSPMRSLRQANASTTRHRVLLRELLPHRDYRLRILLPGGRRSIERSFKVEGAIELSTPKVLYGSDWPPDVVWTSNLPVRCVLRHRSKGVERSVDLGASFRRSHRWRAVEWPMLLDLEDFTIEACDVSGRRQVGAAISLKGLPLAFAESMATYGHLRLRHELAEALRRGRSIREEHNLRKELDGVMDRAGLSPLLQRLRPSIRAHLSDGQVQLKRRYALYRALGELFLADQRCIALGLSPHFEVAALMDGLVEVSDGEGRGVLPGRLLKRVELPMYRDYLFPANLSERDREKQYDALRQIWPIEERPHRVVRSSFSLTADQIEGGRHLYMALDVHQFYPSYWLEISFGGELAAYVCNRRIEDPDDMLHRGVVGKDLGHQARGRQFRLRLDPGLLREGDNEIEIVLRTLGPLGTLLTALRSWELRLE